MRLEPESVPCAFADSSAAARSFCAIPTDSRETEADRHGCWFVVLASISHVISWAGAFEASAAASFHRSTPSIVPLHARHGSRENLERSLEACYSK